MNQREQFEKWYLKEFGGDHRNLNKDHEGNYQNYITLQLLRTWQAAQAAEVPECVWTCDDDVHMPDTWDGECGAKWSFIDGGPKDNEMNYCPQCGGKVVVAAPKPEDVK